MQIVNVFLRAFFGFSLILAVFALMNTAHFAWGQGLVWAAPEEARAGGEAFMADQKLTDMKPAEGKPLDDVRREIDGIDEGMHRLLMDRTELVRLVADAKAQSASAAGEGSFIAFRPGREAEILRSLAARHEGALPLEVVIRIWREIMSAMTRLQGPFRAEVFGGDNPLDIWDLARNYYGAPTPMALRDEAGDVLRRVSKDRSVIGILPAPTPESEPWWVSLGRGDAAPVQVVAALPFALEDDAAPQAFVLAQADFESSGDDTSLAVISFGEAVSADAVRQALEGAGLEGALLLRTEKAGHYFALVALAGFMDAEDARLSELGMQAGIEDVQLIGGFANPLRLAEAE